MLVGQVATAAPKGVKKGAEITEELLNEVERYEWWKFAVADDARQSGLEAVKAQYDEAVKLIVDKFEDRRDKLERRSEEHTSELQSLMRISYAVFCLKKKKTKLIDHVRIIRRDSIIHIE